MFEGAASGIICWQNIWCLAVTVLNGPKQSTHWCGNITKYSRAAWMHLDRRTFGKACRPFVWTIKDVRKDMQVVLGFIFACLWLHCYTSFASVYLPLCVPQLHRFLLKYPEPASHKKLSAICITLDSLKHILTCLTIHIIFMIFQEKEMYMEGEFRWG